MNENYIEPYGSLAQNGKVGNTVRAVFQLRKERQTTPHHSLSGHQVDHSGVLASTNKARLLTMGNKGSKEAPSPLPRKSSLPGNNFRDGAVSNGGMAVVNFRDDPQAGFLGRGGLVHGVPYTKLNKKSNHGKSKAQVTLVPDIIPQDTSTLKSPKLATLNKSEIPDIPWPKSVLNEAPSMNTLISSEKSTLNNLQLLRQPKYKKREKSGRRIKHLEHLQQSRKCNEKSRQTEDISTFRKWDINSLLSHRTNSRSENVYEEIDEFGVSSAEKSISDPVHFNHEMVDKSRPIPKKVTFSTFDRDVHGREQIKFSKKIAPGILYGIAEVTTALREKNDYERREIALLCYSAIIRRTSSPSKHLGRIDTSRRDEDIFLVLDKDAFEIRDAEGLIIAKHRTHDIGVITDVPMQSNIIVYIGRCKFSGRIGVVMKFTKAKHASVVVDLFRNT